ncbi:hypothetical protein FF38_00878, partial [Lucilia cuprina]
TVENLEPSETSEVPEIPEVPEEATNTSPVLPDRTSKHMVQPSIDSFQTTHEGSDVESITGSENFDLADNNADKDVDKNADTELDSKVEDLSIDSSKEVFEDAESTAIAEEPTSPKLPPRHPTNITSPPLPPRHQRTNSQFSNLEHDQQVKSPELPRRRDAHKTHKPQNSSQYDLPELPRPISFP